MGGESECKARGGDLDVFPGTKTPKKVRVLDATQTRLTASHLKMLGVKVHRLYYLGYTLQELVEAQFTPSELLDGGFTCKDLNMTSASQARIAGLTRQQCISAGFTKKEIADAGY